MSAFPFDFFDDQVRDEASVRRRSSLNILIFLAAIFVALTPLWPAYGTVSALRTTLGAALIVGLVLWSASRFRLGFFATLALLIVGFYVFGGVLVTPGTSIFGFFPGLTTLETLTTGVVSAWKEMLTLEPPLGSSGGVLVVPYFLVFVGGATSVALGQRAKSSLWRGLVAWVVVFAVLTVAILFGTNQAPLALFAGLLLLFGALFWLAWVVGSWRPKRYLSLVAMLLIAAVGASFGSLALQSGTVRFVLRDTMVPPFDPLAQVSPLSGYRAFIKDYEETQLLQVTGLTGGQEVRLATMDTFDGVVWNVGSGFDASGAFRRVGDEVDSPLRGVLKQYDVTIVGLAQVWLPTVGFPTSFDFRGANAHQARQDLRFNDATGGAVLITGLPDSLQYRFSAVISPDPSEEELLAAAAGRLSLPEPLSVPQVVEVKAREASRGVDNPYLMAKQIEEYLATTGYFSHGIETNGDYPSLSGHGASRIESLLGSEIMVGDDEQYASAMALMMRSQGVPARVVLGFVAPEDLTGDQAVFTGKEIRAWTEVFFSGVGWVSFFPTPDATRTPSDNPEPVAPDPLPKIVQPPPPLQDPLQLQPDASDDSTVDSNRDSVEQGITVVQILVWAGAIGLPLILLFAPFVIIVLLKAKRRQRRLSQGDAVKRVLGGWDEILDTALDGGVRPPLRATRRECGRKMAELYSASSFGDLAFGADLAQFSGNDLDTDFVVDYWHRVEKTRVEILAGSSRWQRFRIRVSTRSLRRSQKLKSD